MKKLFFTTVLAVFFMAAAVFTVCTPVKAETKNDSKVSTEDTAEISTGDTTEVIKTGWASPKKGYWYYYSKTGKRQVKSAGWYKINNKYYYLRKSGERVIRDAGWYKLDNKYYYLRKSGKRVVRDAGWYKLNNKYYYIRKSGVRVIRKEGWYQVNGKYYYLKKNGTQVKKPEGWYKLGNKMLYIRKGGKAASSIKQGYRYINDRWYYLMPNGKIIQIKNAGWKTVNGKSYYIRQDGKYYTGWAIFNGKTYYFSEKGKFVSGWFKKGAYWYYQSKDKGIYKNDVVYDSSAKRYYYVNEKGRRVDTELTRYLVEIWVSRSTPQMTREQKLRAFFDYFGEGWDTNHRFEYNSAMYVYDDYYGDGKIGTPGFTERFALQMLKSGKGNCYRWAICFGYMARMLGYDAYLAVGTLGPTVKHGWTQIKIDGTTYVFDPEVNFKNEWLDLYMKTYDNYIGSGDRKIYPKSYYRIDF